MPPGDSLNDYGSPSGRSTSRAMLLDEKMEEEDWEAKMMEEAQFFKEMCDELKAAHCPLFGGRYCTSLSQENREKAAVLDDRLDAIIAAEGSFKSRTRDRLRIFIAQGELLSSFKEKMKSFDFSLKCNVVWSSDAIAYRCNTCAFNPCMSLCADCFQHSNHEGHDFNRFFSQAGGACDCGNLDVLRESGFCARHGPNAKRPPAASPNVVSLAEFVIPKLFVRLFLYFRGWSKRYEDMVEQRSRSSESNKETFSSHLVNHAHMLIEFLQELIDYGGPLRDSIARILLDRNLYAELNRRQSDDDLQESSRRADFSLDWRTRSLLEQDAQSLGFVAGVEHADLSFGSLLDELVFWMIRLIFPQNIINLCLSILSDVEYRDAFAVRFFSLYPCVAEIMVDLAKSERNQAIYQVSSRIIHISVQILSSEAMCTKLDDEIELTRIIILSTYGLLNVGVQPTLISQDAKHFYSNVPRTSPEEEEESAWKVFSVESNQPLKKHSYWTLVSDMQNLLGHATIAKRFFRDPKAFGAYASMVALMQGMNVNFRVVYGDHVEYDTAQPYQLSFHLEWEVAALNMYNTLGVLTDEVDCMVNYLTQWISLLKKWLAAISMNESDMKTPPFVAAYHLPLHRHLSAGISHCIVQPAFLPLLQSLVLSDEIFLRQLALHPIRIQVCRAETSAGMWARNGNAARNQSFYYAQTNYNTGFLDCDLFLLRFIAAHVNVEWFLNAVAASFYLDECFTCLTDPEGSNRVIVARKEWVDSLVDGALRLILELLVIDNCSDGSGLKEIEREIVAALAVSDLTHSKLKASIPEKGSRSSLVDDTFDGLLRQLSAYSEPDQGSHIQQGVYRLTLESWRDRFEPVFCRMRATTAREYNDALLRAEDAERGLMSRPSGGRSCGHLWTPFRLLDFDSHTCESILAGVCNLLTSPSFFTITHKILSLHVEGRHLSESILQQAVYLLTLSVKLAVSRNFASVFKQWSIPRTSVLISGAAHDCSKPADLDPRSFVLSMFTLREKSSERDGSSILSLLIRYLRMSLGDVDSAGTDSEQSLATALREQMQKPADQLDRVSGYALDYIGRLLNLLYHNLPEAYTEIETFMGKKKCESPGRGNATEGEESDIRSKAERRLTAKRRQEALLAAHQKKNAFLMNRMMIREGLTQSQMDAMDTTVKSEVRHYECPICSDTTASTLAHPVGLLVRIITNYAVEHSRPADTSLLSLLQVDAQTVENFGCVPEQTMLKHCDVARRGILETRFEAYADLVQLPTGIEVRSCGHFAHVLCYKAYVQTLLEAPVLRVNPLEVRVDVSCPMCRAPVHGLLPLAPDIDTERHRLNLSEKANDDRSFKSTIEAVKKCLQNNKPALPESDLENFLEYRQSFLHFANSCEKWTSHRGEIADRLRSKGQTFTLGLAKANCDRNILISELDIFDRHNRILPTEHLVYGARYEATKRDLTFANFQFRQLVYGFENPSAGADAAEGEERQIDRPILESELDLPDASAVKSGLSEEDASILNSSSVEAKIAVMRMGTEMESEIGPPVVLFDMKSALVRLSAYVITNDSLVDDEKIELLAFLYSVVLAAAMVRTAVFGAVRLPLPQMRRLMRQQITCGPQASNSDVFSYVALSVVQQVFLRPFVNVEDLLMENSVDVNFVDIMDYACTDLARFTAQLWHECGVKKLPADVRIGHSSFAEMHSFLTGSAEVSLKYLPSASLSKWVHIISRWIQYPAINRMLLTEPLKWRRFSLLELPADYDQLFSRFFGRQCINCAQPPRTPFICLLCSSLLCLDQCCLAGSSNLTPENEVERHALQCGSGVGCFLSLNSSLTVIVARHRAALWGSVYLDSHGEEDRNLRRGKPLYLSTRRFARLRADWVLQSFEQLSMGFFNFEHLPTFLRDAHYVLNN